MFYHNIPELVKAHNYVLIAYAMSYAAQVQMPLVNGVDHMLDGLLEDLLLY